jgi:hypothetical protein
VAIERLGEFGNGAGKPKVGRRKYGRGELGPTELELVRGNSLSTLATLSLQHRVENYSTPMYIIQSSIAQLVSICASIE